MNENQNNDQEHLFSNTKSDPDIVSKSEKENVHQIKERENPYISGSDRSQTIMFPLLVDEYVSIDNPVRFIEAYVNG